VVEDVRRGEIWVTDLDPVVGHEQAGQRPVLIVSVNAFNRSGADLFLSVALTTRERGVPYHVSIAKGEGGAKERCFAMCEQLRSLAKERLVERWGQVSESTLRSIEERLRRILGL
jgi:mRNA interferase MazF